MRLNPTFKTKATIVVINDFQNRIYRATNSHHFMASILIDGVKLYVRDEANAPSEKRRYDQIHNKKTFKQIVMHNIHVYKPSVEIELTSKMSSLEMTDVLESLSLMINNRGLMNVNVEDLKMLAGRPCDAYIGYSEKDVEDALNTFCIKTAPDDIKALIIYGWTSYIKDAHRIRRFANECTTAFHMEIKWGIQYTNKQIGSKILVLYSTKKAASHQAAEEPYQVEESYTYRKVLFPLGISAKMKKGDIDWNFFK